MKAWQVTEYGKPLELRDVAEPVAGAGQVVVDVKAVGLCHTDIGEVAGQIAMLNPPLPFTLGHEIAGVVVAVGDGVADFRPGDRVALPASISSPGIASDGGFAERVVAKAVELVHIPDSLDFLDAAPATDAGMTSMHALRVGGVQAGTRLGIIGLGGLGSMAAQIAVALGAEVYAAELNEDVWETARGWGVKRCATDITEFKGENLQVIIDYAGFGTTTAAALLTLGHGGRAVQVGASKHEALINTQAMIVGELSLHGSQGGTPQDCLDVVELIGQGKVTPLVTRISFEEIGEGLERLDRGEVRGRLVAVRD